MKRLRGTRWEGGSALLMVLLVAAGCGPQTPFRSVPVSGVVTYDDGSPIPVGGMTIYFYSLIPPKDGMHPRPARVQVGSDLSFDSVTTYKYKDGLAVGEHKVSLVCLENGKPSDKIPADCQDPNTTPLRVEVKHSGQELMIQVPKP